MSQRDDTPNKLRVSVVPDDTGHEMFAHLGGWSRQWDVFVDGDRVDGCRTADVESGVVEYLALNARGKPYAIGDEVATRVRHGSVQVLCDGTDLRDLIEKRAT